MSYVNVNALLFEFTIKAVTRIFSGGVTLSLSAVGAKTESPRGGWSGEGVSPFPKFFFGIFYFKMVSFCACLHGFLFGIFYRSELCHRNTKLAN